MPLGLGKDLVLEALGPGPLATGIAAAGGSAGIGSITSLGGSLLLRSLFGAGGPAGIAGAAGAAGAGGGAAFLGTG